MNKHIEEMAKDICDIECHGMKCKDCDMGCEYRMLAEALHTSGYRKESQEGAECPTCHGTGRIGTTDWLTKNISKEQLAKEKAEAVAEHEAQLKRDVAREIFEEIDKTAYGDTDFFKMLKKKYESEGKE